jgi:hypothetical protein
MRILIVAMTESIHTARWINQLARTGWDVHLFPSRSRYVHPALRNVTVHGLFMNAGDADPSVRVRSIWPFPRGMNLFTRCTNRFWPVYFSRVGQLARIMRKLKFDVVHSLEIQHAGYLTLAARKMVAGKLPPWIVTNWGNDIYYFGRLPSHAEKVTEVLSNCDWYSCECHRDVALARQMGLRAPVLPVFPNAGGIDLDLAQSLRAPGPVSARRWLILKGYQNWRGRAQVGFRALEMCTRELQPYQIAMYSAEEDIKVTAEMFTSKTGLPVTILGACSHEEILGWFGRSRVHLGLNVSDGVCTAMLEAIAMGAFAVQSETACADEWLVHGETGFIVPPEDPYAVANALRCALTDDAMVDSAAARNEEVARKRLDQRLIQPMAIDFYQRVVGSSVSGQPGVTLSATVTSALTKRPQTCPSSVHPEHEARG